MNVVAELAKTNPSEATASTAKPAAIGVVRPIRSDSEPNGSCKTVWAMR